VRPEREAVAGGAAKRPRGAASKQPRAGSTRQDPVTSSTCPYEAAQRNTLTLKLEALALDESQEALMEQISVIVAPHAAADGQEIELDVMVRAQQTSTFTACCRVAISSAHLTVYSSCGVQVNSLVIFASHV
jgi:hypothetical protein